MKNHHILLAVCATLPMLFGFTVPGCGPKKAECEALTKAMEDERANFGSDKDGKDDFKKMGKKYRSAQETVEAVKVTDPELKTHKESYVEHLDNMATAAEITAKVTGGEISDPTELQKAKDKARKALDAVDAKGELDLYLDTLRYCGD